VVPTKAFSPSLHINFPVRSNIPGPQDGGSIGLFAGMQADTLPSSGDMRGKTES